MEVTGVSVDLGLGDVIRAIVEWINRRPSKEEILERIPRLVTKLAILSGLNSNLADALLSDGPANVPWMHKSLDTIKGGNGEIYKIITSIDSSFGMQNGHLITELTTRIAKKIGSLDNTKGEEFSLDDINNRKGLGELLREQARILQELSDKTSAAFQETMPPA